MPDDSLIHLGAWLRENGYRFITVTPATHARVWARAPAAAAASLQDVFGWSRPFERSLLPEHALKLLEAAGALEQHGDLLRSRVRYSTLDDSLYVHSAYPTTQPDAVFFGPDTYRFAALIRHTLRAQRGGAIQSIVDIGCGSGAGGIVAAHALRTLRPRLILTDINPAALRYARANAALAGLSPVSFRQGDLYAVIDEPIDLIVANPPYLLDAEARAYRHGGGDLGSGLSLRIVVEGIPRLASGGTMILYTGAPMVSGNDPFLASVQTQLEGADVQWEYFEMDPDVFGKELDHPAYAQVERIAAVALVIRKRAAGEAASAGSSTIPARGSP